MEPVDRCPCCDAGSWERVGSSVYARGGSSGSEHPGRRWADAAQRELVFTHWLPGEQQVELTELLCERCGVIVYSPRPSEADLRHKYELLKAGGDDPGTSAGDEPGEARRARAVRDRLAALLPAGAPRILDVGGGDGRVMAELVAAGAECFVVDHSDHQVAGVTKLADTVDQLDDDERFDAVVLAHVLEHVAAPGALVRRAAELAPVLYAEVPVEVWRGTPVRVDPVVHVNHFTRASLEALLRHNGWRVARSSGGMSSYRGAPLEIAWAVGARGHETDPGRAPAQARARLRPSLTRRLRRRLAWQRALRRRDQPA